MSQEAGLDVSWQSAVFSVVSTHCRRQMNLAFPLFSHGPSLLRSCVTVAAVRTAETTAGVMLTGLRSFASEHIECVELTLRRCKSDKCHTPKRCPRKYMLSLSLQLSLRCTCSILLNRVKPMVCCC